MEDHLYFNGMSSTYTRWIHHGEPLHDETTENVGNLEGHIDFNEDANEDVVMDEEHEDPDDRLPDMLQELYAAEQAMQS